MVFCENGAQTVTRERKPPSSRHFCKMSNARNRIRRCGRLLHCAGHAWYGSSI